jgi:5-methylcytosine-specific restriction enzyme A
MRFNFAVGNQYSRRDVYRVIGIPEDTHGGVWDTGYARLGVDWFIFANIGIPGRTGHNYHNEFIGDDLLWSGKENSHIGQPSIQSMVNPEGDIYIFTRTADHDPFTFSGCGRKKEVRPTVPVTIIWEFVER